jgi:uncharacterized protein (DUF697 family)
MTTTTFDAETVVVNEPKGNRLDLAGAAISSATKWSAAAGIVPVPYLDLAALAAVQGNMIINLAEIYGERVSKQTVRGLVSMLLGTLLPANFATATVGASAKLLPGFGTLIGAASLAAFGAAATYGIGKVFVRHFEHGGTVATFKTENIQEELKAEFAKAADKTAE